MGINLVLKLSMAASWRLQARRLHLSHADVSGS
jgi:hypothetical protein